MEIFRIAAFVLVAVILATLLRQYLPTYAVLCVTAASVCLLLYLMGLAQPIIDWTSTVSDYVAVDYFGPVLKAVGIGVVAQNIQDVCKDAGMNALAGKVELAGRCLILVCALPLFQKIMEALVPFLQ